MHNSDGAQYRGQLCVPCGRDGRAQLPVDARIRIGKKLAQVYDAVLAEPVPARFLNLLARLAQDDKRDNARFPAFAGEGD